MGRASRLGKEAAAAVGLPRAFVHLPSQSFCQYRGKVQSMSPEEIENLKKCEVKKVGGVYGRQPPILLVLCLWHHGDARMLAM